MRRSWQECRAADRRHVSAPTGTDKPRRACQAAGRGDRASNRDAWPTSLLRRIWEALMEVEAGPAPQPGPRGPLAQPARLRPAARLRAGGRRLAGGRDVAARAGQAGPSRRPPAACEWLDPLAADRAADWRPASSRPWPSRSWARSAACTGCRSTGKGRGGDFSFPLPRNGRNLAAAGLAGTACRRH